MYLHLPQLSRRMSGFDLQQAESKRVEKPPCEWSSSLTVLQPAGLHVNQGGRRDITVEKHSLLPIFFLLKILFYKLYISLSTAAVLLKALSFN